MALRSMPMKRTDRPGALLAREAGLEQADDALLLLADAHQQDLRLAALDAGPCRTA